MMISLFDRLQGEGSYTYECRKSDCWHCQYYRLTPLPETSEHIELIKEEIKSYHKKIYNKNLLIRYWAKEEDRLIMDNIWMNSCELVKLFKGRTKKAVAGRKHRLRKMGKLLY